jgi:hypothetical protein
MTIGFPLHAGDCTELLRQHAAEHLRQIYSDLDRHDRGQEPPMVCHGCMDAIKAWLTEMGGWPEEGPALSLSGETARTVAECHDAARKLRARAAAHELLAQFLTDALTAED